MPGQRPGQRPTGVPQFGQKRAVGESGVPHCRQNLGLGVGGGAGAARFASPVEPTESVDFTIKLTNMNELEMTIRSPDGQSASFKATRMSGQ